jgi:hypothetical protein
MQAAGYCSVQADRAVPIAGMAKYLLNFGRFFLLNSVLSTSFPSLMQSSLLASQILPLLHHSLCFPQYLNSPALGEIRSAVACAIAFGRGRMDQFKFSAVVNDVMPLTDVRSLVHLSPAGEPLCIKAIKNNISDLICYMSHKAAARCYGLCDGRMKMSFLILQVKVGSQFRHLTDFSLQTFMVL